MAKNKSTRQRTSQGYFARSVEIRELVPTFLIVCEGEKTEPNYFRSFRVPKDVAEVDVVGEGFNTKSLVERTILY